jgi:hypothetical protein
MSRLSKGCPITPALTWRNQTETDAPFIEVCILCLLGIIGFKLDLNVYLDHRRWVSKMMGGAPFVLSVGIIET